MKHRLSYSWFMGVCISAACAMGGERIAQPEANENTESNSGILPLSTCPVTNTPVLERPASTVSWKGRDYEVEAGIEALMAAIRNPTTDASEREAALDRLGMLSTQLHSRKCIEELISVYPTLGTRMEEAGALLCFVKSEDPRALPLMYSVLDREKDPIPRMFAAGGLAQWNIRRGVVELVALFESKEVLPQPARMPYLRDNALGVFGMLNVRKGWGFSEDRIREEYESRGDVADPTDWDEEQKWALVIAGIKKWFGENEQRFPDWKPGDPLPEANCRTPATVAAEKGWRCDRSCAAPADFDDCVTCCRIHESCTYCCSAHTRVHEQLTDEQRAECLSFCDLAFKP
ncbi:MAG: hypothetical protein KJ749_14005 [Planctomycetes bacterium]|nr:hypothetical protein [Planctomycetota bacterium]